MATYTEYCCRASGSNLNAGTLDGSSTETSTSPLVTYTSGNWVQSTRVFTVASGNPVSDGVAVGQFASVYADGASAPTGYIGRIAARDSTTITISNTAIAGTAPTDGTGNRTLKVGGAWLGPTGASGFPFTFGLSNASDGTNNTIRVNFKNDQTYSVTAAISIGTTNAHIFRGYTSSYGDSGRATLDGGTSGASYALLTTGASSGNPEIQNFIIQNNGATGSAAGLTCSANFTEVVNCVITGMRGHGVTTSLGLNMIECEVYGNNLSNTVNTAGINSTGYTDLTRCIVHDNTGSNTIGIRAAGGKLCISECIVDTNGGIGIAINSANGCKIARTDVYNNATDGLDITTSTVYVENSNFLKNGTGGSGYGIDGNATTTIVRNCGFGSGSQANATGDINGAYVDSSGTMTYASGITPWVDPANGDFRINLQAAKGAGRGAFTETAASYSGSLGYPDIGSNQHLDSAPTAYAFI